MRKSAYQNKISSVKVLKRKIFISEDIASYTLNCEVNSRNNEYFLSFLF